MNCHTLKRSLGLSLLAAWLGLFCSDSSAAVRGFLHIEGVPGESVAPSYAGWIEIHDLEQSLERSIGSAQPAVHGLRLSKSLDKSTPLLFGALAEGRIFPNATLALALGSEELVRFYRIELANVTVAALDLGGSASDRPDEQFLLFFDFIEWTYTEYDLRGRPLADHIAYWDLIAGEGGSDVVRHGFRVTASRPAEGEMRLRWEAVSGRSYRILQSASVTGPYLLREIITADDETGEITLPVREPSEFFLIEEER